jgi:hypothetical protein
MDPNPEAQPIFLKKFEILIDFIMFLKRKENAKCKKRIAEDLFIDLLHWDRQAI